MAYLIIQGTLGGDMRLPIRRGANSLGRRDGSDVQILHPSVSGAHGELVLANDALTVRDFGSTNGTFVGGQKITEATVKNGQSFYIGEVAVKFLGDNPIPAGVSVEEVAVFIPKPEAPVEEPRGPLDCKNHAGLEGAFVCSKCFSNWCMDCVKTLRVAGRSHNLCPVCSNKCIPMEEHKRKLGLKHAGFLELLPGVFMWPLRKNGPWMMLMGALTGGIMSLVANSPFAGQAAMVITLAVSGYLIVFLRSIVESSSNGENEMPDWPEFHNWVEDLILPYLQFLCIVLLCFGPATLVLAQKDPNLTVAIVLAVLGGCYFPMALLAVTMAGGLAGLNPLLVVSAIVRVPKDYFLTVITFVGILGSSAAIDRGLEALKIPVFPTMISTLVGLYGFTVVARMLGLLFHANRKRIGWFD